MVVLEELLDEELVEEVLVEEEDEEELELVPLSPPPELPPPPQAAKCITQNRPANLIKLPGIRFPFSLFRCLPVVLKP